MNLTLLPTTGPATATGAPPPTSRAIAQALSEAPTLPPAPTERPAPPTLPPLPTSPPLPTVDLPILATASAMLTQGPSRPAIVPEAPTSPAVAPRVPTEAVAGVQATTVPPRSTVPSAPQPTAPVPRGWQVVADATSACQYAVPPDWQVSGERANAPGGQGATLLQVQSMLSWDAYKDAVKTSLRATTIHTDTATRLWFERAADQAGTSHVVAVPVGDRACLLQITITPQGASTLAQAVRQIAASLGPAQ